jgi:hypothetical protein
MRLALVAVKEAVCFVRRRELMRFFCVAHVCCCPQDEAGMAAGLSSRGYDIEAYAPPLALGDATWHAGWTLHSAPGQPAGGPPRVALAASFFADGARRLSTKCACAAGVACRRVCGARSGAIRAARAVPSTRIASQFSASRVRRAAAKRAAPTRTRTRTLPFFLTARRIPLARAQAPASHAARRGRKRLRGLAALHS